MDPRRHHQKPLSFANLFNLESLTNFQVPQPSDDSRYRGESSQDESRSSQDHAVIRDQYNGAANEKSSPDLIRRRKRHMAESDASTRRDADSNDEDDDFDTRISEEQYRAMLGEHVEKYRKVKFKDSSSASARVAMPSRKRGAFSSLAPVNDETGIPEREPSPRHNAADANADYDGGNKFFSSLESSYLDIGEGITYQMPPSYDELAFSLKLPRISDIRIEERLLNGALDLRSLAAMISTERRLDTRHRSGMGEPQPQYESLQARLKGLSTGSSDQKFSLHICNVNLDPYSIPEGAAGRIRRSIMDESGTLQVYYVKVLEKGDTYEIIERSLPKKQVVEKAPFEIEEEERDKIAKVWINIVKKDIPKHHKIFSTYQKKQLAKRFAESCQREVKLKISRSLRIMRTAAVRTRKLSRDMVIFWKKVDKEQSELRKKEERDAAEALKREEEQREAKRQQQRLNFLLSQTELYSHFMGSKPSSQDAVGSLLVEDEFKAPEDGSEPYDVRQEDEDPEEAELKKEALRAAQEAVSKQKKITKEFDDECLRLRIDGESVDQMNDSLTAGSSDIDLLNPSTMPVTSTVQTPEMFKGCLKEYQLKGLQWLVNCYEQGLNGILADEMGLGKTIQAMAFLAHLAEEKNIWGPFLVVAPSSVLNNWADEVSRFCPDLKTLPYWGSLQDRQVLRRNINAKRLYRRESGFHILITSYQLLVGDEKYLRRVKWQYMVLDEAQAIKSSNSIRWKTLLSFNCRNRLLLTGTPVQNNMAELWALLHFIMPTLFDSHEQFNEWFSKGIESHAENGGTLNEHQLNRLHAVLKPFMLRRVKKDVISEMTGKTEITVHCKLSSRQKAFYRAIKDKISLAELFDGNRGHLNDKKILNLMNIVIQLRKVCNHPELFERNEGSTYFYFAEITNYHLPPRWNGDRSPEVLHYGGSRNPITYKMPKLVYQEMVRNADMPSSITRLGVHSEYFGRFFDIFSPSNIQQSIWPHGSYPTEFCGTSGTFGFTRLMNLSPSEVSFLGKCTLLEKVVFSVIRWDMQTIDETLNLFMDIEGDDLESNSLDGGKVRAVTKMLLLPTKAETNFLRSCATGSSQYQALFTSHQDRLKSNIRLLRAAYAFIPPARAPPIDCHCHDRGFAYKINEDLHHPWIKKLFVGFARTSEFNGPGMPVRPHHLIEEMKPASTVIEPFFKLPYRIFGSAPPMQSFDPAKMLTDSGKLQTLDILLKRLRAENHRVLLFAQMTKMLNIIEDYMNYRKYKYFRLDGSSAIMDRRDMVRDFQRRNDIFVFLLSTRAGGLGINLTAADTVIFYESDWNPTLDLQAMDRAHRLGQTKEVTVYRLICKETVEEKILQRASQKNTVQQLVMTGGHVQGDLLKPEDVVSLLLDDAQLEQKLKEIPLQAKERQKKKRAKGIRVDADGGVSLEDLASANAQGAENELENPSKKKSNSKKKKSSNSHVLRKVGHGVDSPMEGDELSLSGDEEDLVHQQKPKRLKRPTKSVNETIEPAFNSTGSTPTMNFSNRQQYPYGGSPSAYGSGLMDGTPSNTASPGS